MPLLGRELEQKQLVELIEGIRDRVGLADPTHKILDSRTVTFEIPNGEGTPTWLSTRTPTSSRLLPRCGSAPREWHQVSVS